ncbi:Sugar transferase involved in LPS biosynthesis (colanic, teichoic acid) [Salinihabitans flavidus]|uniref:Sugar transferase involved in LPS biosynthesis (Colanic, teichoic acid) n=1 Tax=Salinihabitans flavidus TaxID=569882 RepID=A0A1H8V0G2_9RHOB|nr:sugar transferase [Salinihabitans flavidus]SEP08972.1 Sugar transferase involved in LPS biosynthesis (colanic, teichoic acid) [Salinihabitans flavidus]
MKRAFDLILALLLCVLLAPLFLLLTALILLRDGLPVFYVSERMRAPGYPFRLWKFRTMRVAARDSGVSGGDKAARVTPTGRFLRRTRLDELPQLLNVLRGDISFVGPRPPLRQYVEQYPDIYAEVLACRPGITGLATLICHGHEERLLARCATPEETDAVYRRACIPRKARLDLIYRDNWSVCLDLWIMWETLKRVLRRR